MVATQLAQEKATSETPVSLCESCSNAVPQRCLFMRSEDAETALDAMGAKADAYVYSYEKSAVYRVTDCPKHIPGELPPLTEEKYNLSCPYCGSVNSVKVAWTGVLPPEEWYCRCGQCNKSFRPKKREVKDMQIGSADNVLNPGEIQNQEPNKKQPELEKQPEPQKTRREIILEKITQEAYEKHKNDGLSDEQILEFYKLPLNWKDALVKIKRGWGINGPWSGNRQQKEPKAEAHTENTPGTLTISEAIELHDELEEEVECLDYLLTSVPVSLTKGIKLLLDERRCEMARKLHRIHEVFEETKVAI